MSSNTISGGPWYLRGIVSFGSSRCNGGIPGIYTNVEYYMDWIIKHLEPQTVHQKYS